jgi:DNA-binding HxlR family transcriptional regulator
MFEQCLGCKWSLHVLSQVRAGVRRPGALERSAAGLTAKVLAERLVKLQAFGLLEKRAFAEVPPRVEYHLTGFGERVTAILDQIAALAADRDGVPRVAETAPPFPPDFT